MLHEPLEPRRLFAGVTLITHGYQGDVNGWVATAAEDVEARAGGSNYASIYTMSVAASGGKLAVTSFAADDGQKDYRQTLGGEMILKLDWSTVSTGSYTTQAVASVVSDYMLKAHGSAPALAQLPLHLIGHSRGASLVTALSQDFGQAGVWVDQATFLDPHPVDGDNDFLGADFGDQKMAVYDNVAFADDYWRTDGDANNSDFDGEPVTGAHQGNLNSTVQQNFFVSAHIAVTAYYNGTIDTSSLNGGDHPVIPSWYNGSTSAPDRDDTGFAFSTIGGKGRPSDGVSTLIGGRAKRVVAGQSGSQWANAFNFTYRGASTVTAGTVVSTQFFAADRDGASRVDVYLDQDTNPYDGAGLLTGKPLSQSDLQAGKIGIPTAGLKAGSYYLAARATDSSGHVRWSYTPVKLTITVPDFASVSGGILTVNGTAGGDKIVASQNGANVTLTLNGAQQTFAASSFSSVQILPGGGNDSVDASAMTAGVYIFGGDGKDTLAGGSGNDTLTGGASADVIHGFGGEDRVNGGGGNDLLYGDGGDDRLYSNSGNDTLDGGSNVDRLFGSDGNESLIGGTGNDKIYAGAGNDTLIGGAGSDILDGGLGVNSADNDPLDLRTDIDTLLG